AEDGIRDFHVTGVQTCALPISNSHLLRVLSLRLPSAQGISEFAIGTLGAGVGAQHVEGRGRGGDLTVQLLDGCFVLLYPYRQPAGCLDYLADIHPVVDVRRRRVDGHWLQRLIQPRPTRATAYRVALAIGGSRVIRQRVNSLRYRILNPLIDRARAVA